MILEDWRINTVFLCFSISFILILLRLFSIQILNHQKYVALTQEQYSDQTVIPAKRGDIISADGYVLAGNQSYYLMFAEPKRIKDPYQSASDLADLLTSFRYTEDSKSEEIESAQEETKESMA